MVKGSINQEDITGISLYASIVIAPKRTKQTLTYLKGEIGNSVRVVDFTTPFSIIEQADKESVKRDFPGGAVVENPPANAGDTGSSPGREDPTCRGATEPVSHNY